MFIKARRDYDCVLLASAHDEAQITFCPVNAENQVVLKRLYTVFMFYYKPTVVKLETVRIS